MPAVPVASRQIMSPTERNVRLIGRTCTTDGITWLAQSGSAVEFSVEGRRVTLQLVGGEETDYDKELCPRFAVLLDGEVVLDDTLDEDSRTVEVYSGNTDRSAVVEVMQLSEAKRGVIGVETIVVESSEPYSVTPTLPKDLSIEFIGDSITCAYGVESASSDEPFVTTKENFMKSYAYLAAEALNADYSTVCYSAFGVVSGWTNDGTRRDDKLVPPLYERVSMEHDEPWDSSAHHYDIVVINLGTNDFTYTGADKDRMEEFVQAYIEFLKQVRANHPESYIICTLGTMGCEDLCPYVKKALKEYREATGDTRNRCYRAKLINEKKDGIGTYGHPNATTQKKCAKQLVRVIRKALRTQASATHLEARESARMFDAK